MEPTLLADAQLLSRLGHASESCSVAAQVQAAHPSAEDLAAVETLTGALRCGRAGTAPDAAPVESPTIGGAVEPARLAPRRKKEARLEPTRIEPERRSAAPVSALPAAPAEQKGRAPDGGTSTGEAEARPAPESQTKRVAVHVVGEPPGGQAEFYGTGLAAQNAIIAYLRRLHVDAVPVSLHGLVSGLEAQGAALRVRAHYSLMVRMESLSISQGAPFSPLSLTGKVHVVLLQDGNARLDRSVFLPITAFAQSEPPGKSVARAITATMETLGTELTAQLARAE